MSGPVRKLVIFAAVDGLILQPSTQRNHRPVPSLQITYNTHDITAAGLASPTKDETSASFDAHGIVGNHPVEDEQGSFTDSNARIGLLNIASVSYLISISRREQVAQIRGLPIYTITAVTLIPLSSQFDAKNAIIQAKESLKKEASGQGGAIDDSDTSDDEDVQPENVDTEDDEPESALSASPTDPASIPLPADKDINTSVAEDVIGKKGQYGRFAERWFSKKGWSTEKRWTQGMSTDAIGKCQVEGDATDPEKPDQSPSYTSAISQGVSGLLGSRKESIEQRSDSKVSNTHNVAATLLPKLLRTTKMLFGSRSFFFSYDYDLTRGIGSQEAKSTEIPMHKIVDPFVSSPLRLGI